MAKRRRGGTHSSGDISKQEKQKQRHRQHQKKKKHVEKEDEQDDMPPPNGVARPDPQGDMMQQKGKGKRAGDGAHPREVGGGRIVKPSARTEMKEEEDEDEEEEDDEDYEGPVDDHGSDEDSGSQGTTEYIVPFSSRGVSHASDMDG